jgi:hypothetical protein
MAHLKATIVSNDGHIATLKYSNGEKLSIPREQAMDRKTFLTKFPVGTDMMKSLRARVRKKV